jgi:hypothetical protein
MRGLQLSRSRSTERSATATATIVFDGNTPVNRAANLPFPAPFIRVDSAVTASAAVRREPGGEAASRRRWDICPPSVGPSEAGPVMCVRRQVGRACGQQAQEAPELVVAQQAPARGVRARSSSIGSPAQLAHWAISASSSSVGAYSGCPAAVSR